MKHQFYPSATFRGLRHIPFIAISRNSLYPSLEMDEDTIYIQVVRRHPLPLSKIAKVHVGWLLGYQVTLIPRNGPWTFTANFFDKTGAIAVLRVFGEHDLSLTDQARSLIAGKTR